MDTWVTVALMIFGFLYLLRHSWVWLLVGLDAVLGLVARDEAPATWEEDEDQDDVPATVTYAPIAPHTPMSADEWMRLLNEEPDAVPHVAACGPSGSGKSTFVLALIQQRRSELVITTLKNATDDPWGGFPAARLGFRTDEDGRIEPDWSGIEAAIDAVYQEVNARHADGRRPRTPLTLVIDELTATVAALGRQRAVPRLIHMWLTARSVNVRLIVMDPTANVAGWGLEGRGDVRESIAFVRCERNKAAMLGSLEEVRAGDGVPLDTHDVPALAVGVLPAQRAWRSGARRATVPSAPVVDFAPPTSANATGYEVGLVRAWHAGGLTGMRALARKLYDARGGTEPYDGSGGPYYAVRGALEGVSAETLETAL